MSVMKKADFQACFLPCIYESEEPKAQKYGLRGEVKRGRKTSLDLFAF